ncbi:hypothetical protein I7I48_05205 [Histoplasma ohiense]|nr:hypothetical protein I7I48_05205 [Histoplasma ohiense (nom. inval.)]
MMHYYHDQPLPVLINKIFFCRQRGSNADLVWGVVDAIDRLCINLLYLAGGENIAPDRIRTRGEIGEVNIVIGNIRHS